MGRPKKNLSNCKDGKLFFANYPSYLCLLLLSLMIYQHHDVLLLPSIISLINFYSLTYLFYCAATNPTTKTQYRIAIVQINHKHPFLGILMKKKKKVSE